MVSYCGIYIHFLGASDDAMSVGVMLEMLEVLIRSNIKLNSSVVFLFNGAEESLQEGSHAFITQHEWGKRYTLLIFD